MRLLSSILKDKEKLVRPGRVRSRAVKGVGWKDSLGKGTEI